MGVDAIRASFLITLMLCGCNAAGHDQTVAIEKIEAAAAQLELSATGIGKVGADVNGAANRIETAAVKFEANVKVGGGGDSVTAWLYACIAGAALLYPLVIRPTRQYLERRRSQVGSRKLSKRQPPIRSPPVARELSA